MKKAIVLRVDPTLFQALKSHHVDTGVPVSEFIRRAIRMALFADAQSLPMHSQGPEVKARNTDGWL
jgi:ribbon-helix-helix protein